MSDQLDATLKALDAKNVIIGRLTDDVMRLTKAVASRDQSIKNLRYDLESCMARELALMNDLPMPRTEKP